MQNNKLTLYISFLLTLSSLAISTSIVFVSNNALAQTPSSSTSVNETYHFVKELGSEGSNDGQFNEISGIAVDSKDNLYVADFGNKLVQKFDSNGNFITKWGSEGSGDGQFNYPEGIAVDSSDNVYVADRTISNMQYNKGIIKKFDSNGNFITKWIYGSFGGSIDGSIDIATESNNVYISIGYPGNNQKFDSDGNFITKWVTIEGTGDGQFYIGPDDLAIDKSGNMYLTDSDLSRIQKFDSNLNFITKWGSEGISNGQFDIPFDIAVDSIDNVYVADYYNNRIQKFDSDGTFITKWGSEGSGDGQFNYPNHIATDSSGKVYVIDSKNPFDNVYDSDLGNNRIQVFATDVNILPSSDKDNVDGNLGSAKPDDTNPSESKEAAPQPPAGITDQV